MNEAAPKGRLRERERTNNSPGLRAGALMVLLYSYELLVDWHVSWVFWLPFDVGEACIGVVSNYRVVIVEHF